MGGSGIVIRVVVAKNSNKERLKKATEAIQTAGLPTEKFDSNSVLNLTAKDSNMYVCDPFEGEAFEHLVHLGCRVVGPQCVLSCLENDTPVPKVTHPVYTISMRNVNVTCSSIEKIQRDSLHKLIEWMGGSVSKMLTDCVTHLIVGEVGSKKYQVAANFGKPIVLPEWVQACWDRGQHRHLCATDESLIQEFTCPIFRGCAISATQLDSNERRVVRELTVKNGGQFSGQLKFNECTHLIVNNPVGPKYEFARKWKVRCVTPKWFYDSIERGSCQDENLYEVDSSTVQSSSTPKGGAVHAPMTDGNSVADFSGITNASLMTSMINDTVATEANYSTMAKETVATAGDRTDLKELDQLDVSTGDGGLFLDGCKVFLSGFSGARLEKLRKIVNSGGATRFNQINESVSHVIVGEKVPEHVAALMQSTFRPHVVSPLWLVDSFRSSRQVDEEPYNICLDLPPPANPASPQLSSKYRRPSSVSKKQDRRSRLVNTAGNEHVKDDEDVMQLYLPGNAVDPADTTANDSEIVFKARTDHETSGRLSPGQPDDHMGDEDATQMEEDEDVTVLGEEAHAIFAGKTFMVLGFPPEQERQIVEMTVANGGQIKSSVSRTIPDYAVMPINGCDINVTVGDLVVSNCWLQMCIELDMFLDPSSDPLFSPLTIVEDACPLCDCVVTVSQFAGVERDCLVHIAELLGASCQEYFSRRATKDLKPNTHLLLKEPSGSKYKAAKKWKIPAVTKAWLLETAKASRRQEEGRYDVDLLSAEHDDEGQRGDEAGPTRQLLDDGEAAVPSHDDTPRASMTAQPPEPMPEDRDRSLPGGVRAAYPERAEVRTIDEQRDDDCVILEAPPIGRGVSPDDISPCIINNQQLAVVTEPEPAAATVSPVAKQTVRQHSPVVREGPSFESIRNKGADARTVPVRTAPVVNKHLSLVSSGVAVAADTPSKFLTEGVVFHPVFDTKDALDYLESPAGAHHKRRHTRKSSLPLDDFFHMNVAKAVEKTGEQADHDRAEDSVFNMQLPQQLRPRGILKGVIICVSKKLITRQGEYNAIAVSLGGEFRFTFDDSSTHFIFKGKVNDTSKEFRAARNKGLFIVSPLWLLACEEEGLRVDETSYPHTYNPKMSLSVVSNRQATQSATPARRTRQTRSMLARTPCRPDPPARHVSPLPPPPQDDEVAMDGFNAEDHASTESDEEMIRAAEATERESGSEVKDSEEGSLELREDLQKQLEGIMSSTMNVKGGPRRSRLKPGGSKQSTVPPTGRHRASHQGVGVGRRTRGGAADSDATKNNETLAVRAPDLNPEASQNVQITWDDPTGRKEREKIMAHLKRGSSPSCCNEDAEEDREDAEVVRINQEAPPRVVAPILSLPPRTDPARTPTPQAPPIRLPVANPPVAPQPVESANLGEPTAEVSTTRPRAFKFLLSGMSQDEKIDYSALIEQLGGIVKDGMYFDVTCTHIVVGNPSRNEKYLASLASGKWVLHKSFLEACRKASHFVEEDVHEWGNATDLNGLGDTTQRLAVAACRWRQKLQEEQPIAGSSGDGAFSGWTVILYIDKVKEASFKRILQAGGAEVVGMRPPFGNLRNVGYAFMDLQKTKIPEGAIDLEALALSGTLCLKTEYIAEYLMNDTVPDPANYYISEVKSIMSRLAKNNHSHGGRTPSKRKRNDLSATTPKNKKGRVR